VAPGVKAIFYDAGHILGSAITILDITEDGRSFRLAYSGDLGRPDLPILRDPSPIKEADYVIMESTYGNREHESPQQAEEALQRVISETAERNGKVIIPAFAVGRTQEIVYALHRLAIANKIPDIPVFVDSPLAVNVTEIFRLHPECYDEETHDFMLKHQDPFGFGRLRYIRQVEQSKELNYLREPAVIISASGMCEAGRILHHLKNNIEDPRNTVLIVGFQAEHTLGRRIVDRESEVPIFGERYKLRARVEIINGYSAHADRRELLMWVDCSCKAGPPQKVFLVHGDPPKTRALAEGVREHGVSDVVIPERLQEVIV
jgi:metallo-beta-lactamase family protein